MNNAKLLVFRRAEYDRYVRPSQVEEAARVRSFLPTGTWQPHRAWPHALYAHHILAGQRCATAAAGLHARLTTLALPSSARVR